MGPADRPAEGDSGFGVRERHGPDGAQAELPPLNYKLMDEVVRTVRSERPALLGDQVAPEKQSSVITTVYNISRRTRTVDSEVVSRIVGLMA